MEKNVSDSQQRTKYVKCCQRELDSLRSRVSDLEGRQERLKDELRTLQDNQATMQRIDYLAKDVARNEDKHKKLVTKRTSEFLQLFGSVPDAKSLRVEFRQGQDSMERRLKAAETEQHRLASEIRARQSARADLKREADRKAGRAGVLEDQVRDVLAEGAGSLPGELAAVREQLELARRQLQAGLATKNPPHPKKPKKTYLKNPLKMGFLGFFKI
jgi:chromosome segregation ATPase